MGPFKVKWRTADGSTVEVLADDWKRAVELANEARAKDFTEVWIENVQGQKMKE